MIAGTIVRLGVRSVFGRWRGAMLIVLPVVLLGMAVLVRALIGDDDTSAENILYQLCTGDGFACVTTGCVVVFGAIPMLVAGWILRTDEPLFGLAFAVGTIVSGAAYCALFALLSVLTRHAVVVGLIYLLIWESLLGELLDGVRWLSITRWSAVIVGDIAESEIVSDLPLLYALLATVVTIVAGTWLTGNRLRAFNLTGDE